MSSPLEKVVLYLGIIFVISGTVIVGLQIKERYFNTPAEVNFEYSQTAIVGDTVVFKNNSKNLDAKDNWSWSFGDDTGILPLRDALHVFDSPGTFTVMLKYSGEIKSSKQQLILIRPKVPKASFSIMNESILVNDELELINDSEYSEDFYWLIKETGQESLEQSPKFKLENPGSYSISLIAANSIGQVSVAESNFQVEGKLIEIESIVNHTPIFNQTSLSRAFSELANQDLSRNEKRGVRNRIISDARSLSILVNNVTLENYLNKIQLEASSANIEIEVTSIQRSGNGKISGISIR